MNCLKNQPFVLKDSKEELRKLIETIKSLTGLTQTKISVKAGYEENTLTQALSKKEGHEAVLKRLKLVFANELKKSTVEHSSNQQNMLHEPESDYGKDQLIQALREIIAAKQEIIEQLKQRLSEKNIQGEIRPTK